MTELAHNIDKKSVVIVAMTGNMLLDIAGPADVFYSAEVILQGLELENGYHVSIVSPTRSKALKTAVGIEIKCDNSIFDCEKYIDTLIIAGNDFRETSQADLLPFYTWLAKRTEFNTRRIASVCGGAFVLAKVGLLQGRKATTHWELSEKLTKENPTIKVNANPFFTIDGHILTSAGVSSGIDLALAMVEQDYSKDIAIKVARKIVFYLSRPGFQAQFGYLLPVYDCDSIGKRTQKWLLKHIHEKFDVGQIAEHLNMSTRNFSRVFIKQTGMSPAKFVEKLRVEAARKHLEDTNLPLEIIAERCGLGGLVSMRRVFLRHLNITPSDYRRAFKTSLNEAGIAELLALDTVREEEPI